MAIPLIIYGENLYSLRSHTSGHVCAVLLFHYLQKQRNKVRAPGFLWDKPVRGGWGER